ncbi:MAG: hypothetical protein V1691_03500 [Chloroflexota bacterium]
MGTIAAILGGIGGLSAAMGIVTALEVIPSIGTQFTWTFWFMLAVILLLSSIAFGVARGGGYE